MKNKQWCGLVMTVVIGQTVLQASAEESSQAFFRLSGPVPGTIQLVTQEGFLSWTSAAVVSNSVFTIERSDSVSNPSWAPWSRIPMPVGVAGTNIQVFDLSPPEGMTFIPGGQFTIGLISNEVPRYNLNTVYTSPVYMDTTEVTWSTWIAVYQWATNHGYNFSSIGTAKGANHPVVGVNFYDILKWCNARSQWNGRAPAYYTDAAHSPGNVYKTGQIDIVNSGVRWDGNGYRLPTESEWEKAARGGREGGRYSWSSNEISHADANYKSTMSFSFDHGPQGFDPLFNNGPTPWTSPVGSFAPNPYGLYDMIGNVFEWVWDVQVTRAVSPVTLVDPKGPDAAGDRGVRGGSFYSNARVGVDFRTTLPPSLEWKDNGFRTVISR